MDLFTWNDFWQNKKTTTQNTPKIQRISHALSLKSYADTWIIVGIIQHLTSLFIAIEFGWNTKKKTNKLTNKTKQNKTKQNKTKLN